MKKYIITGGPGVGKTSTIEDLRRKGFYVVSETAREIIEKEQAVGGKILPWIDLDAFNIEVLKIQKQKESEIPEGKITFLDRGIIDALAYYTVENKEPIPRLKQAVKETDYDIIFLLEQLPAYITDEVRREDAEKAKKIHEEVEKTYRNLGFKIIKIPFLSIEERTKLILNFIK